ncbi:phosphoserine phosphatase SerB [Bifidobacterium psychraerophilum]|uniref:phosphoserine phosphatase SerB n=1 Tax=Bifidobacterium psychraerophilum TaxID=218140 RepID=UPI0005298CA8|nr:phosphoserine phosphatase SerB [Bifidobacterium psychraerophilum]
MADENLQASHESKRLLVMDVDSTLIDEEVIDMLGQAAGSGECIAQITRRAMLGELDFKAALAERVGLLEGMPASVLDEVYAKIHFTKGALAMIDTAHSRGWKVGVVSGGFSELVNRLVAEAHIDHSLANGLEILDGTLTGKTVGTVVTKSTKLESLHQWAEEDGVAMSRTVAIGDGANDIPMIEAAGIGIAFCAKPAVQQAAHYAITQRDLMQVISIIDEHDRLFDRAGV